MPYVVTQPCCGDASCVLACPVNCIHPAPGDPGFATAEMVYIDARACVGCGACVTACPVGAVKPDTQLTPDEQPFVALAAEYYDVFPHRDRMPLALVPGQRRLRRPDRTFRVAVVGAGPAGLYTADELLKHPEISVDVLDRMPVPHGLARFGVAPDHQRTRSIGDLFAVIAAQPGFGYRLGVEVGRDVTHADLVRDYHAVVYAVGAAADRRLGVPGEDLPGSLSATDLVGWYTGHPERRDLPVPLAHGRVVVLGMGNVALDVARILTADPDRLAETDIAPGALAALSDSAVREVVLLGRRGPADAAFTTPELVGLAALSGSADVDVLLSGDGTSSDPGRGGVHSRVHSRVHSGVRGRLLADLARRTPTPGRRRIVLRFHTVVDRIEGDDAGGVTGVTLSDGTSLPAGLVVRAVGYRGLPVPDLPHDPITGVVPNDRGRVSPGVYVVGWAKRGPTGFLGTNKSDAEQTVGVLLDDLDGQGDDLDGLRAADPAAGSARRRPGAARFSRYSSARSRESLRRGLTRG